MGDKLHIFKLVEYLPAFRIVATEERNLQPEFLRGTVRAAR